jgi:histidinol-phosphatase (PHP family)
MERTCQRAADMGLPAVAFTDHADYTPWSVPPGVPSTAKYLLAHVGTDGLLRPPELVVDRYLESIERCRDLFPGLRILSGVELGEPHWHAGAVAALLGAGRFDRVLGSLHSLPMPDGERYAELGTVMRLRPPADVVRRYLAEIPRLLEGSGAFSVLAHIDYPARYWSAEAGPFDAGAFEEEFRHALRVLAGTDRALEINTRRPVGTQIVRWWHEAGGTAVTFGSDAHRPENLARRFTDAAAIAQACGFRPGQDPYDPWPRA